MNLNVISWVAFAVVVFAVAFFGFRVLRQRLEQMRYQEQLAELEFQETLLATMSGGELGDDSRFMQAEAIAAAIDSPIPPAVISSESFRPGNVEKTRSSGALTSRQDGPLPAEETAAGVMKQLGAAGLVTGIDGHVPVHGNPKGAVLLRLRNGKSALLVPQMESEAFLRHNARRADMIIMVGHDGKAFVVSTLEHFLADNIGQLV